MKKARHRGGPSGLGILSTGQPAVSDPPSQFSVPSGTVTQAGVGPPPGGGQVVTSRVIEESNVNALPPVGFVARNVKLRSS